MYEILSPLVLKEDESEADWTLKPDQLEKLSFEISSFFKLFWGKKVVKIETSDFFETIQYPIKNHLNREVSLHSYSERFYDPILNLYSCNSRCLRRDAKLASEKSHFLTTNHRDILQLIDHINDQDLIKHNAIWSNKLENSDFEGDIQSWIDLSGPDPLMLVIHELNIRRKELEGDCNEYHKRFNEANITLHDTYEENEKWAINREMAQKNNEKRRKELIKKDLSSKEYLAKLWQLQ